MFDSLFTYQEALGIHLQVLGGDEFQYRACQIRIENKTLQFEKKLLDITHSEGLRKAFSKVKPIGITVSGKGILYKSMERVEEITPEVFSRILPNAAFQDFYIQNFISGELSFLSIIRKAELDKILAPIRILEFTPVIVSLGPFPVSVLIPQLNWYAGDFIFDGYRVERDSEGNWQSVTAAEENRSPFPIKAESEIVDERILLAYASAFQILMQGRVEAVELPIEGVQQERDLYNRIKKVKGWGIVTLGMGLLILFINFFLFSSFLSENSAMERQVNQQALSEQAFSKLKQSLEEKESAVKAMGWEGGIHKSILMDQLLSQMPREIQILEIAGNPLIPNDSHKKPEFAVREIEIRGLSGKILSVEEWISRVKTLAWVKEVQLESYNYQPDQNSGQFSLIIKY